MSEQKRSAPKSADRAFVVQFRPQANPEECRFRGRVEQVASGDARHFESVEQLVGFFARSLERLSTELPESSSVASGEEGRDRR